MVKKTSSIRIDPEEIKSILVWDQFYRIALDTTRPLPVIHNGNKYILVAIDHYFKWVEAQVVTEHDTKTATKFLEDDIIFKFGVLRYILTDNGGEWVVEFDQLYKNYSITHQYTVPQWPRCNNMVE